MVRLISALAAMRQLRRDTPAEDDRLLARGTMTTLVETSESSDAQDRDVRFPNDPIALAVVP
jgi:hypothetical protein